MDDLKIIRKQLGLSQRDFASLTGISRTRLAMSETNRRPSPGAHQSLLNLLEGTDFGQPVEKSATTAVQNNQEKIILEKTIKVNRVKLNGQLLQMENLEAKLAATGKLICGAALLSNTKELTELSRLQATVIYRRATAKLLRYRKQWLQYRLRIVSLEAVINEATLLNTN